jgi:hypothetical protein
LTSGTAFEGSEGESRERTVLCQDVDALLDEQIGIEDDKAEGEWQDIVAGTNFEEIANRVLQDESVVS